MASYTSLSLILLSITQLLSLLSPQAQAQTPLAPAPAPSGPINITGILDKAGGYGTFIRLLTETQVANQINNQANTSTEGMTVIAPTDNAFNNLPAGTLNKLTDNQQVQLVLNHVLPKYYSLTSLQTVSNPVRTQATGQEGGVFGLNFTGSQGNQVNVSCGAVETQIYNAVRPGFPLAVYQVDKVLVPQFSSATAPTAAPPAANTTSGGSNGTKTTDENPASPPNASGRMNVGLGLVGGLSLFCMGLLS
ncbi:hypothetical protein RJ640_028770 [Escallonia rubra]|uniref:FAS1 domain-containing protein n=1 Tax=Escallonia rubra TaxID=112253 RepID=A0AA88QRU8_9ASTE|nr:hypothetical protein RJ640_028770 [Escallonia rubra]